MASIVSSLGDDVCCLTGVKAARVPSDNLLRTGSVYRRPFAFSRVKPVQALALATTVAEIMLRHRPAVVQVATAYDGYIALLLRRWVGLPFVVYAAGNEILDISASDQWGKPTTCLRKAARVLAISDFTAEQVAKLGVDRRRIVVLHPACDVTRFEPREPSSALRARLLPGHPLARIILTVGNLVARKGHDMVIRAMPAVLEAVPDAVYLIVGDGPNRGALNALVAHLGLEDRVMFAGRLPDERLPDIYALADVFAMVSRMDAKQADVEGFGIVFLEANACGKPVVAGRSGGIPDAVADGVSGLLVDPLDTADIAEKLVHILRDPALAARLGEQGRERVHREFTWARFGAQLGEILRDVAAGIDARPTTRSAPLLSDDPA